MPYAERTTVPIEKSRGEIETLLQRHGADRFATSIDWKNARAVVTFYMENRMIQFEIGLPDRPDKDTATAQKQYEQMQRQRWRALLLVLKAKLEAIENDISTFDHEFMAHIVVPSEGVTVGDLMIPMIEEAYRTGGPLRLPAGKGR